MTQPMSDPEMGSSKLEMIHEDMRVVDADEKEIGHVDGVYLGEVSDSSIDRATGAATPGIPPTGGPEPVVRFLANIFDPEDDVPQTVRGRMEREGFFRIGGGVFRSDRYVLSEQISHVQGDTVYLKTRWDDLIK